MATMFTRLSTCLRGRLRQLRATGDAGYTTETVLITALLVALALVAIGLIAAAVTSKAGSLDLG